MSQNRTSGFDALVQITENEINTQLETAFLAGLLFPPSMSVPFSTGVISVIADLNFLTPVVDLDRPRPQIGITVPFANSQLQVTSPFPFTLAPLGGTITIVDSLEVVTEGTNQIITVDFNNGSPVITVRFDTASQSVLAPVLTVMTLVQIENLLAGFVLQELQSNIGRIDFSSPIPVVDDTDPTTVFDIKVTTINDTSAADRDCVVFGIRMSSETGGNINNVTTNFIPQGASSTVMLSNFWLLARVMRPRVASSLGLQLSDFDTPLRLNRSVPAPGGRGTLTSLEARVEGNRIRVDGTATDSGTGWSAVSNFTFFIDIFLSNGSIQVVASNPIVNTDVDLEWWVWLLGLGLGGLFGGIVGIIIAAIVLAVIEAVAESMANNLIAGGISGALGNLPSIPLGPIGSGMQLSSILLDDLELRSNILHSVDVPVRSQGSFSAMSGFTIDLDTGIVGTSTTSDTDLVWNPMQGFIAPYPVGLTITGINFGALSPVVVSRLPFTQNRISLNQIPVTSPSPWPFLPQLEVVCGLRTSKGRYAKLRAWRSAFAIGQVNFEWVTYDTPVPELDIKDKWSIIKRGEVTEYITTDCSYCRTNSVQWCGVIEAWPKLMPFPVNYQWCLCGVVLQEGEGEVHVQSGTLSYKLKGRRLCIKSEMGQDIDCELCVSAIDSRNQELFTCIRIIKPGKEKQCKKCTTVRNYKTEYIALADTRATPLQLMEHLNYNFLKGKQDNENSTL